MKRSRRDGCRRSFIVPCSLLAAFCAAWWFAGAAIAQDYPRKVVRLIVPFAPGGQVDVVGRFTAARLSVAFGRQVVVDNRPGAGGNLGT
ncbi:MAG: tripartite tricarboxylate transporter substrate binding protein, partial [Betaproteobacteria bacterium]|nr:tripartite tricarboxylate transporter substrate binding protein [Betaproteobacteria bacterium]